MDSIERGEWESSVTRYFKFLSLQIFLGILRMRVAAQASQSDGLRNLHPYKGKKRSFAQSCLLHYA